MTLLIEEASYQHPYSCSNNAAIETIKSASRETPIILDFDETLFLRNSTEEYLNSLQPRFLGAILLFALSLIKPWWLMPKAFRGEISRDWLRVLIATLLFPWTPFLWRLRSKRLANLHGNTALLEALNASPKDNIVIASNGFDFIIRPIANQLDLPVKQLIACRFWQGAVDRHLGKKALLAEVLSPDALSQDVVVTDSIDDELLLQSVAKPCLTQWPSAKYIRAMGDFYIPFFYTDRVKQPGEQYIVKVILAEDLLFVVLCTSWLSNHPIVHAVGMTFLMSAFWCIYELGYMENDVIAEKLEANPKLSPTYLKYKSRINFWQPWIWALLFSLPGVALLQIAKGDFQWTLATIGNSFNQIDNNQMLQALGVWAVLLGALRLTYVVYNYVNKPTRVWLYPILQGYKCFGFLAVTSTNLIGSLLFLALCLSRWMLYLIYRYGKGSWYKVGQVLRCVIFASLVLTAAIGTQDISLLLSWQAWIIFILTGLKAQREFRAIVKELGWITDPARS